MAKLPHQSTVPPVTDQDTVSKEYGDSNYVASGGGGIGGLTHSLLIEAAGSRYAEITDGATGGLLDSFTDLTLEAWIRPAGSVASLAGIVSKNGSVAGLFAYSLNVVDDDTIQLSVSVNGTTSFTVDRTLNESLSPNKWTHIAGTWDGATGFINLYQNGVLCGAANGASVTGTLFNTAQSVRVGNTNSANLFDGNISDVRIWNVVREAVDILAQHSRTIPPNLAGLQANWGLNLGFEDQTSNELNLSNVNDAQFEPQVPYGLPTGAIVSGTETTQIVGDAPTGNQVLKADGQGTASWQAPTPIDAAEGAVLTKSLPGDQAGITADTPLNFTTVNRQDGDIANSGQQWLLKANRNYLCIGNVRLLAGTFMTMRWYNVTAAQYIGRASVLDGGTSLFHNCSVYATLRPTQDVAIELRAEAASGSPTVNGGPSWAAVIELGAVQADVVGGLEFVDVITLDAPAQSLTFGTSGDGVFQRALDGELDETYEVEFWIPGGVIADYEIRPNGNAPAGDMFSARHFGGGTGLSNGVQVSSTMRFAGTANEADRITGGTFELHAKSGKPRIFHSTTYLARAAPGDRWRDDHAGEWSDESTPITSLELYATAASGFPAGTRAVLWRKTRDNVRADTAGVYERQVQANIENGSALTVAYTTGRAAFTGSAVGLAVSLPNTAVTGGDVTVVLKVGGVTALTAVLDTTNTTFHRAADRPGIHPAAFGDDITVEVTTNGLTTSTGGPDTILVQVTLINNAFVQGNIGAAFAQVRMSADQTLDAAPQDDHIEFDLIGGETKDLITLETGTGQQNGIVVLQPGRYYEIQTGASFVCNETTVTIQWYDLDDVIPVVDVTGEDNPQMYGVDNSASDRTEMMNSTFVVKPTTQLRMALRLVSANSNVDLAYAALCHVFIKELK